MPPRRSYLRRCCWELAARRVPGQIAPAHPGWSDVFLGRAELCCEPGTSPESGEKGAAAVVNMGCVFLCTQTRRGATEETTESVGIPAEAELRYPQRGRGRGLYSFSNMDRRRRKDLVSAGRGSTWGLSSQPLGVGTRIQPSSGHVCQNPLCLRAGFTAF